MADVTFLYVSGNNLFAGVWGQEILLSTDNGHSWNKRDSGLPQYNWTILATREHSLLAGTAGNGIYRSTVDGKSWLPTELDSGQFVSFIQVDSILFAASYGYGIFKSTDDGKSWVKSDIGITGDWVTHIIVKENYLFCTSDKGLFRSSDTGRNWIQIDTGEFNSIISIDTILLAATNGFGIVRSSDNGRTWKRQDTGSANLSVYCFAARGEKIFAGVNGGVFQSLDNGITWSFSDQGITDTHIQTIAVKDSFIFAGAEWGGIFSSIDGSNWENVAFPYSSVYSLAAANGNVYAGADYVGFFRSGDEGANWLRSNKGLQRDFVGGLLVHDSTIFAGVYDGVYHSIDNGSTWNPPVQLFDYSYFQCFTTHREYIFAGTGIRGVFRSHDGGITWERANFGLQDTIVRSMVTQGDDIFAGTNTGVYRSIDDGMNWVKASLGLPDLDVNALAVIDTMLFAGTNWGVYRSSNSGETWTNVSRNLVNQDVLCFVTSNDILFAGTLTLYHLIDTTFIPIPSGIFYSSNLGDNWIEADTGLPILDIRALTVTNKYLFAGTGGQGVWRRPLSDFGINAVFSSSPLNYRLTSSPNPLSAGTTISFSNDRAQYASISIMDLLGKVRTHLFSGILDAGEHLYQWDASHLPQGMYYCVVRTNEGVKQLPLLVVR
ncbi:MAG: T9SS type A sorting domain-containing protein [Bacteroidota bacterium]|nr:T9SS type A sorting domain-containing protein [Bacteroidota bacterium]MDP4236971.1 T9SS type A sorting domain-containing protein [Bacteroidota bacterium]